MKNCILTFICVFIITFSHGGTRFDLENVRVIEKDELAENFCVMRLQKKDVSTSYVVISTDSAFYGGIDMDTIYSFVLEYIRSVGNKHNHHKYFGEVGTTYPSLMTNDSLDSCFVFKNDIKICLKQNDVPFVAKLVPNYIGRSDSIPHIGNKKYRLKGKTQEEKALRYFLDVIAKENFKFAGLKFQVVNYGWGICYRIYDYYNKFYNVSTVDNYPNRWEYLNHVMPSCSKIYSESKIKGISKLRYRRNSGVLSITECWEYMGNLNTCIQLYHEPNQKFYFIVVVMDSEGYPIEYFIEEDRMYKKENVW